MCINDNLFISLEVYVTINICLKRPSVSQSELWYKLNYQYLPKSSAEVQEKNKLWLQNIYVLVELILSALLNKLTFLINEYGGQKKVPVEGYPNCNWAEEKKSWRSTSGFIFIFNNSPINWCSKRQLIVALLSIKPKYIALILVVKKANWLGLLLIKLNFLQPNQQHILIQDLDRNTYMQVIQ